QGSDDIFVKRTIRLKMVDGYSRFDSMLNRIFHSNTPSWLKKTDPGYYAFTAVHCTEKTLASTVNNPIKARPVMDWESNAQPSTTAVRGLSKPRVATATVGNRAIPRNHSAYANNAPAKHK